MTFDEWWAESPEREKFAAFKEGCRAIWEAATANAANVAREQKKRYTCNKMRGVCDAIADTILNVSDGD